MQKAAGFMRKSDNNAPMYDSHHILLTNTWLSGDQSGNVVGVPAIVLCIRSRMLLILPISDIMSLPKTDQLYSTTYTS